MKAYSLDLRERVVRAVDQGYKRTDIGKLFGVSSTIKQYLMQRRETGHMRRKPMPGCPAKKGAPLQAGLVAQLEVHPDATLDMHCQLWEQTSGARISTSTMSRAIRRVGWTGKKKTLGATERDEEARAEWREQCTSLDATKLVVIDECGTHIGLTPLYARAPRGKRVYDRVPRNRGKNLTLIAALTRVGLGESMLIEGSANTIVFDPCIEKILAPRLTKVRSCLWITWQPTNLQRWRS